MNPKLVGGAGQDCATPPKSDVEPSCQTWWLWWGIVESGNLSCFDVSWVVAR